jgi:hypothetical protein
MVRVFERTRAWTLRAIALAAVLFAVGFLLDSGPLAARAALAAGFLVGGTVCWLIARQRVEVDAGEVRLVYPTRTVRLGRRDPVEVDVEGRRRPWGETIDVPVVRTHDGTTYRLPGLQPFQLIPRHGEPFPLLPRVASELGCPVAR